MKRVREFALTLAAARHRIHNILISAHFGFFYVSSLGSVLEFIIYNIATPHLKSTVSDLHSPAFFYSECVFSRSASTLCSKQIIAFLVRAC